MSIEIIEDLVSELKDRLHRRYSYWAGLSASERDAYRAGVEDVYKGLENVQKGISGIELTGLLNARKAVKSYLEYIDQLNKLRE